MFDRIRYEYQSQQVDLACLDTLCGDFSDYGLCLAFAWHGSATENVGLMFEMHGAVTLDNVDPETWEDKVERWRLEDARKPAAAEQVAA